MTQQGLDVKIEVDQKRIERLMRQLPKETEEAVKTGINKVLKAVDEIQVASYTSSSKPAQPPGSRYRRTFRLQRGSRYWLAGKRLPAIAGVWVVEERLVRYAEDVVGRRRDQAEIHRNRWKSLEEISKEADTLTAEFIEKELDTIDGNVR